MKKMLVLVVGAFMFVGCGASLHEARWTENYCMEHRTDYNHAALECRARGSEAHCVFKEEWRTHCRISSRAHP